MRDLNQELNLIELDSIEQRRINGGCWGGFCPVSTMDAFVEGFEQGWQAAKEVWDETYKSLKKN